MTRPLLSNSTVDREWPHQVAIFDDLCCYTNYEIIVRFCASLSVCRKTRQVTTLWPNGKCETHRLCCFKERADAQAFIDHFGGVHFDPVKDRVKGRRGAWIRSDEWTKVTESGPLRVPAILL